ncbi:DoxX family protein [Pontimicrobium sp. SW4]|uniref:DoxX family protein n=1 Tax=Pontimicrobium sp. SW4 TaxID=3153519 RepID=A0AAU7BTZ1_9FLAO
MNNIFKSLERVVVGKNYLGVLFIRLAFGFHLLYYSCSDVINLSAGDNAEWLGSLGVPFPFFASWLYILAQFFGGVLLIIGFKTRLISIPLIVTFLVAFFLVHAADPYKDSFQAIQMLAISFFFLFNGSGKLSLDDYLKSKINGKEV